MHESMNDSGLWRFAGPFLLGRRSGWKCSCPQRFGSDWRRGKWWPPRGRCSNWLGWWWKNCTLETRVFWDFLGPRTCGVEGMASISPSGLLDGRLGLFQHSVLAAFVATLVWKQKPYWHQQPYHLQAQHQQPYHLQPQRLPYHLQA